MAPFHRTAVWLWFLFLAASLVGAQREPEHTISYFTNLPTRLFFFDDSTAVVYHDVVEGAIWVSQDEGRYWKLADDIPKGKAAMVIDHPFDNRIVSATSPLFVQELILPSKGVCSYERNHALSD